MLLYATPRFAFLSVKIIRRELSGRHDDHGIIGRACFFHAGDGRKLGDHPYGVGRAVIAKAAHILNELILVANGFLRMPAFAGIPLQD